nr:hypothetical protein L204_03908 [Cryptococcus depauperatus CBS 7855]
MNWQQQPNDLGSNPPEFPNNDRDNCNEYSRDVNVQGPTHQLAWWFDGMLADNVPADSQLNPLGSATGVPPPNDFMNWDLTGETGGNDDTQYSPMSRNPPILVDTRHLDPQNPQLLSQYNSPAGYIYNSNAASLNSSGLGSPIFPGSLNKEEVFNILFPDIVPSNASNEEGVSSRRNDAASVMSGLSGHAANTPSVVGQTTGRQRSHSDVGRLPSNIQSQGEKAPSDSALLGQSVAKLTVANTALRSQLCKSRRKINRLKQGSKSICDRNDHLEGESIELEETKRAQATRIAYLEDLLSRIVSQGGQVDQRTRDEMEGYLKQTKSSIPSQTKWIVLQRVEKEGIRKELLWTILIQANRRPNVETQIPRPTSILALSFEEEKRDRLKASKSCEPNETQNRLRRTLGEVNSYVKGTEANISHENYQSGLFLRHKDDKPIPPFPSLARSDSSSDNPRPPLYHCIAEISAAPSLPSGYQAFGTSIGLPASTQSRRAQIPVRTRATASLNPQGINSGSTSEGLGQWR